MSELSLREREVVELVVKGLSNREIGAMLFVTEKTVKFHLTNIFAKLGIRTRAQLIADRLHGVTISEMDLFRKLL